MEVPPSKEAAAQPKIPPSKEATYRRKYRAAHPEYVQRETARQQKQLAENPEAVRAKRRKSDLIHLIDPLRQGKIYFIQVASGPIKIGFTTKKPKARLRELQVGNHEKLTLLVTILAELNEEKQLHQRFKHLVIQNEWFHPADDLIQFVEELKISSRCYTP